MEPWIPVNLKFAIAEWATYLDHRQEGTDGGKCGLDLCDTRHSLCDIHGLDGIQQ